MRMSDRTINRLLLAGGVLAVVGIGGAAFVAWVLWNERPMDVFL